MTLIIAGHDIRKNKSAPEDPGTIQGLFVAADSTITTGTQTLLSGFKKVYNVPIRIFKPNFLGVHFHDYNYIHSETNCFIAFTGNTLTAQHVLNAIGNHLSELRIGFEFGRGGYQILMRCQPNSLTNNASIDEWDEDMFSDSDMADLLSGEVVRNAVAHSIRGALSGAKRYKIDETGYKALLAQYVLGTYCQVKKRHRIFTFSPTFKKDPLGVIEDVEIDIKEIQPGELAVLGVTRFEATAVKEFERAFNACEDVKTAMFHFLNEAIDEMQAEGGREIDRPSILRGFSRGYLTELDRAP